MTVHVAHIKSAKREVPCGRVPGPRLIALEALEFRVLDVLSWYLHEPCFDAFWYKTGFKNTTVDQNLEGARVCCPPPRIRHCNFLFV